jgi:hypothetical protein
VPLSGSCGIPNSISPRALMALQGHVSHFAIFKDGYDTPDGTAIRDYIHLLPRDKSYRCASIVARRSIVGAYLTLVPESDIPLGRFCAVGRRLVSNPLGQAAAARRRTTQWWSLILHARKKGWCLERTIQTLLTSFDPRGSGTAKLTQEKSRLA